MFASSLFNFALAALPLSVSAVPKGENQKRATWRLSQSYQGSSFFNGWSFWEGTNDPTHGQVNYGHFNDLAYVDSAGHAIMQVDNVTDLAMNEPRRSIRITSNAVINQNSLVIMSANHYPYGCAVWPAWWLVGPNWPRGGEVDIFEGVNLNRVNAMTLHTQPGCTHDTSAPETGTPGQLDCNTEVNSNTGCGVSDDEASYGDELNNAGGGTFATLWDGSGWKIWFWNTGNVPADAKSDNPNPDGWGTPKGNWPFTTCPSSYFSNMQLVFDITLCGDWAGSVYGQTCGGSTCPGEVMSASNFDNAYFSVDFVKVFTS